jgi:hypothetical protein
MGTEQDTRATVKGIAQWVLGANFSISGEDRVKVDGFARKLLAAADNTDVPVAKLVNAAKGLRAFLAGVMPTAPVSAPAAPAPAAVSTADLSPVHGMAYAEWRVKFAPFGLSEDESVLLSVAREQRMYPVGTRREAAAKRGVPKDRYVEARGSLRGKGLLRTNKSALLTEKGEALLDAMVAAGALPPPGTLVGGWKPKGGDGNLPTIPDPTAKLRAVQTALDAIKGGAGAAAYFADVIEPLLSQSARIKYGEVEPMEHSEAARYESDLIDLLHDTTEELEGDADDLTPEGDALIALSKKLAPALNPAIAGVNLEDALEDLRSARSVLSSPLCRGKEKTRAIASLTNAVKQFNQLIYAFSPDTLVWNRYEVGVPRIEKLAKYALKDAKDCASGMLDLPLSGKSSAPMRRPAPTPRPAPAPVAETEAEVYERAAREVEEDRAAYAQKYRDYRDGKRAKFPFPTGEITAEMGEAVREQVDAAMSGEALASSAAPPPAPTPTPTIAAHPRVVLSTLVKGDTVEVTDNKGKQQQRVVATDYDPVRTSVTLEATHQGKRRSGSMLAGGMIRDYGEQSGVLWQPTMSTQVKRVKALKWLSGPAKPAAPAPTGRVFVDSSVPPGPGVRSPILGMPYTDWLIEFFPFGLTEDEMVVLAKTKRLKPSARRKEAGEHGVFVDRYEDALESLQGMALIGSNRSISPAGSKLLASLIEANVFPSSDLSHLFKAQPPEPTEPTPTPVSMREFRDLMISGSYGAFTSPRFLDNTFKYLDTEVMVGDNHDGTFRVSYWNEKTEQSQNLGSFSDADEAVQAVRGRYRLLQGVPAAPVAKAPTTGSPESPLDNASSVTAPDLVGIETSEAHPAEVDDYPYGRKRTEARFWVEKAGKKGVRSVKQTLNPKKHSWNKPKKSTYGFAAGLAEGSDGHVYIVSSYNGERVQVADGAGNGYGTAKAGDPRFADLMEIAGITRAGQKTIATMRADSRARMDAAVAAAEAKTKADAAAVTAGTWAQAPMPGPDQFKALRVSKGGYGGMKVYVDGPTPKQVVTVSKRGRGKYSLYEGVREGGFITSGFGRASAQAATWEEAHELADRYYRTGSFDADFTPPPPPSGRSANPVHAPEEDLEARLAHLVAAREKFEPDANRLERATRLRINERFNAVGLDGNGRFGRAEDGYVRALDVLSEFGIELGEVVNSHLFSRDDNTLNIEMAFSNPDDSFSPVEINNSLLHLTYHKLNGRYEVLAYMA